MSNTFWTKVEDGYYRVFNGKLKYAPIKNDRNTVDTNQQIDVQIISPDRLEKVNEKLGSYFMASDF